MKIILESENNNESTTTDDLLKLLIYYDQINQNQRTEAMFRRQNKDKSSLK